MLNYLILGAGPAGLTFANQLLEHGENDFLVLEAENEPGGLCRSQKVDASPLDIGGGHFLDVRRPDVNEFLFQFMPQAEWDEYVRDSQIEVEGQKVHHPIEANIWEMDIEQQVAYLKSIATAGCLTGRRMPKHFVDWITWKLGDRIAETYMLPYNRKMFGEQLNHLGTYWLEKLPNVNFEETLRSCLEHKAYGQQPGHARFYYPKKYGYGELWLRMGKNLGSKLICGKKVSVIDFQRQEVTTTDGTILRANHIITTIPWDSFKSVEMPSALLRSIRLLKHTSVQIEYVPKKLKTTAHWIYYPAPDISYHRILVRHNFCPDSRGYWTETNGDRVVTAKRDKRFRYLNAYAYPLNTIGKNERMSELLNWAREHHVFGLGRWGEHHHYNSDLTVKLALDLADKLIGKTK